MMTRRILRRTLNPCSTSTTLSLRQSNIFPTILSHSVVLYFTARIHGHNQFPQFTCVQDLPSIHPLKGNINGSILGSFKDRNTLATVRQVRRRDGLKTFHAHRSFFFRYPTTRSSHHDECHPQLWQFTKSCSIQPPQPPHIFLHCHGILPQHWKPLLPVIHMIQTLTVLSYINSLHFS